MLVYAQYLSDEQSSCSSSYLPRAPAGCDWMQWYVGAREWLVRSESGGQLLIEIPHRTLLLAFLLPCIV